MFQSHWYHTDLVLTLFQYILFFKNVGNNISFLEKTFSFILVYNSRTTTCEFCTSHLWFCFNLCDLFKVCASNCAKTGHICELSHLLIRLTTFIEWNGIILHNSRKLKKISFRELRKIIPSRSICKATQGHTRPRRTTFRG